MQQIIREYRIIILIISCAFVSLDIQGAENRDLFLYIDKTNLRELRPHEMTASERQKYYQAFTEFKSEILNKRLRLGDPEALLAAAEMWRETDRTHSEVWIQNKLAKSLSPQLVAAIADQYVDRDPIVELRRAKNAEELPDQGFMMPTTSLVARILRTTPEIPIKVKNSLNNLEGVEPEILIRNMQNWIRDNKIFLANFEYEKLSTISSEIHGTKTEQSAVLTKMPSDGFVKKEQITSNDKETIHIKY